MAIILLALTDNFKCLNSKKIFFLFIFFILNILTFILESINTLDIYKLLKSLNEFFKDVNKYFRIEIPESYAEERNKLNSSSNGNFFSCISSLIFIGLSIYGFKNMVEKRITLKTFRDYLNSGIN